jgi:hypothetical protein
MIVQSTVVVRLDNVMQENIEHRIARNEMPPSHGDLMPVRHDHFVGLSRHHSS